jgi:hypothetical protein
MALTVTIGRNVKEKPMHVVEWLHFQEEVQVVVEKYVGKCFFRGEGIGHSEEWGTEEAFTVVAAEPFYGDIREALLGELAKVGRYYGQEAVAVTEGRTQFV